MIHPSVKFWHRHLSNISNKAEIGFGTTVHAFVSIHDDVKVGNNCQIEDGVKLFNGARVEDEVFLGPGVIVTNDPSMKDKREDWQPTQTFIKRGAHLGAGVVVKAGVTIGEDSMVGAGALVLADVPDGEVWVGNPAKFLRKNEQ